MKKGFTLIELMIVVAIIGFLALLSVPSFMKFLAKAKRAEAYVNLSSLAMAQKAYYAEHGRYSTNLTGADGLQWKPQGQANYTYGFPGTQGVNHFVGKLNTPGSELSGASVSANGFTAVAAGDIDGDGEADVLSIDQDNAIKIIKNDLDATTDSDKK